MSAMDRLRSFRNDWEGHCRWIAKQREQHPNELIYLDPARIGCPGVRLVDLPSKLRDRFLREFDNVVGEALVRIKAECDAELVREARKEAEAVLEDTKDSA